MSVARASAMQRLHRPAPADRRLRGYAMQRLFQADQLAGLVREASRSQADAPAFLRLMYAMNVGLRLRPGHDRRVPDKGPLVVMANQPHGGTVEAIVIGALLRRVRADVRLVLHAPVQGAELGEECLLMERESAENAASSSASAVAMARQWLEGGGAVVVFPAGMTQRGWRDRPQESAWDPLAWELAQGAEASVLPVFVEGRGRWTSSAVTRLHPALANLASARDAMELRNRTLRAGVGELIPFSRQRRYEDVWEAVARQRRGSARR